MTDDNLREALQGMRQPQPGIVYIADVLAHVEPELERLQHKLDQSEASALDVVDERDRCERLLDKFAYTIAPQEVIGEHSSGNDPWENALDMLSSAEQVAELEADRDRARDDLAEIRELAYMGGQDAETIRRAILGVFERARRALEGREG